MTRAALRPPPARADFEQRTRARNPGLAYVECGCGARIPGHVRRCPSCGARWQGRPAAQRNIDERAASMAWIGTLVVLLFGLAWVIANGGL